MPALEELQGTANACRLAAQLFRHELTVDRASALHESGVLRLLVDNGYDLDPGDLLDADFLARLRVEYARIFIGPGERISPYGSMHHPDDPKRGQFWGDSTVWFRRFVKDHGVDLGSPSYDGIPDHIGHELELYALLLDAELAALTAGDDDKVARLNHSEKMLLGEQLLRWVPPFCDLVREAAKLDFFAALARLTQDLLALEAQRLELPLVQDN
jgi:TorA maturation chaperone TorD